MDQEVPLKIKREDLSLCPQEQGRGSRQCSGRDIFLLLQPRSPALTLERGLTHNKKHVLMCFKDNYTAGLPGNIFSAYMLVFAGIAYYVSRPC